MEITTATTSALTAASASTLLYAALAAAAFLYITIVRHRRGGDLPPGPAGLPLIGCLPFLEPNLHAYFARLAEKHGPVFSIRIGSKLEVVVTSPEVAREVLRDQDHVFANRVIPEAGRAIAFGEEDNIVGNPAGPKLRLLRRICVSEMLGPSGLSKMYGLRRREFRSTLRHLYTQSQCGTPVCVGAQMFLTAMNTITNSLWGGKIGSESERTAVGQEFRALIAEITELLGRPNVSDFFPVLAPLDLQGVQKRMRGIRTQFEHMFARIIQTRAKAEQDGGEASSDFLEYMLKLEKEGGDGKTPFTMINVKALLLDMVVGGTETISNTVEWAMAEMILNPRILEKVQQELDQVVGRDSLVEESHIGQLHYLRLVFKETIRLHTPLPLMVPHCPSSTSTIGGYRVPKGTRVFVNVWAIHRNPRVWKAPQEFIPERFSGDDGQKWDFSGKEFDYFPFGSGRRMCAGIAMAERMTIYSLALLLQAFDWKLPEGTQLDMDEKFGVVMKKAKPLVVIPTPRLTKPELYS